MRRNVWTTVGLACLLAACGGGGEGGPPAVATVEVSPPVATVEIGATTQLNATARDASGGALSNPVTWTSGSPAVATVSGTGLVTGVSLGGTTITAASGGKTGLAAIAVLPPSVATVNATIALATIEVGRTTQASAELRDARGNPLAGRAVAWSSSNAAIATVSQTGLVSGVAAGSAALTASSEGKSATVTVNVIARPVNSVSVTLSPASITVGGSSQATFVARDADGNALTGRAVAWSSSSAQVATVNPTTGTIATVAAGQSTITATVEGRSGIAVLTVTPPAAARGTVTGIVTAADGVTPIPDATVEVEETGGAQGRIPARVMAAPTTKSDINGNYTLTDVPTGPRTIVARRGAFLARVNVVVQANQSTPAPKASLQSTGKLAYVSGSFDTIEDIVQNKLGNPIEEIFSSDLGSSAITSKYRMIFLNCGLDDSPLEDPAVIANLRAFVQGGGTIYASDWAAAYVQAMFPGFTYELFGDAPQPVSATVVDASLRAFVGKNTVDLEYDLSGWSDITAIPATATTLLRGTYASLTGTRTNQPLAIVLTQGQGRVVFTTFHNEAVVTPDQFAVLRHFIYLP